jgi:hypothetical protein
MLPSIKRQTILPSIMDCMSFARQVEIVDGFFQID